MAGKNREIRLCLGRGSYRAGLRAGTAFDAHIGIDFVLAISFRDRVHGAFRSAGAAADAVFRNFVSHKSYLQKLFGERCHP